MGADRRSIHCPWLKLARQCRAVPSPAYPASQQVLLVWAQCCANTAHDWWTGAGSCPASLECALTELMSDWISCVRVPVLSIVNAKAKFTFQTLKNYCLLNFRIIEDLTMSIIILPLKEMAHISFSCRSFIRIAMTVETRNVWEHCVSYKNVKKLLQFFLLCAKL